MTTGGLETSAFAFASDLADEGVDAVLGNIQERGRPRRDHARVLVPRAARRLPAQPAPEGAAARRAARSTSRPTSRSTGAIQPRVDAEAAERDVLAETCRAAAARGMRVDAWTIFLHADRPDENQDCVTVNAFGDRYPADLCPAHPDVARVRARARRRRLPLRRRLDLRRVAALPPGASTATSTSAT